MVVIPDLREAALVSCCGAMYMFGGCEEQGSGSVKCACNSLVMFKPRQQGGVMIMDCKIVTTGM